jgi:hypothetical protein
MIFERKITYICKFLTALHCIYEKYCVIYCCCIVLYIINNDNCVFILKGELTSWMFVCHCLKVIWKRSLLKAQTFYYLDNKDNYIFSFLCPLIHCFQLLRNQNLTVGFTLTSEDVSSLACTMSVLPNSGCYCMGKKRNVYRAFIGRSEGKSLPGRLRRTW